MLQTNPNLRKYPCDSFREVESHNIYFRHVVIWACDEYFPIGSQFCSMQNTMESFPHCEQYWSGFRIKLSWCGAPETDIACQEHQTSDKIPWVVFALLRRRYSEFFSAYAANIALMPNDRLACENRSGILSAQMGMPVLCMTGVILAVGFFFSVTPVCSPSLRYLQNKNSIPKLRSWRFAQSGCCNCVDVSGIPLDSFGA